MSVSLPTFQPPVEIRRGLLDLTHEELVGWLAQRGEKPLRARQLRHWILERGAEAFAAMSDLPKRLRSDLNEAFVPLETRVVRHLSADDGTHKLLVQLRDGQLIECVLIQEDKRRTACVSTQVGCGMGCVFCASGLAGVERNLSVAEIVEQLVRLRNLPRIGPSPPTPLPVLGERGEDRGQQPAEVVRLTNLVVMGMGEPLANLENLLEALDIASAPDGLGIGARHITISTVGLPAKMRQLADLGKQYHLAVSLHAANDKLRTRIVPTNDKTGLADIMDAADYFFAKTGRQVTFEYVLMRELNDEVRHARDLARLLTGRKAHVNVIPFNDVSGLPYRRPTAEALAGFLAPLRQSGISVKVRKRKGAQIDAACGQLRRTESGIRNQQSGFKLTSDP